MWPANKDILGNLQTNLFLSSFGKDFLGRHCYGILGLLLDTKRQLVCIPEDNFCKALNMISYFLNKANKKATVLQFQKLCGSVNFLCRHIVPGRTF